jgi:septum formation topological specificity factor MinE
MQVILKFFTWDEDKVKFEITKKDKRVYSSEKEIKKEYDKFKITTEQKKIKFTFKMNMKVAKKTHWIKVWI